jgi:hypothetical protein
VVRYSGVGRVAGALLILGSILYLVGAYNVYRAIKPFTVIREHWTELTSIGFTEEGLIELSIVTLETSQLVMLRVVELVKVLALASLLYGLAFITMNRRVQETLVGLAKTLKERIRLRWIKRDSLASTRTGNLGFPHFFGLSISHPKLRLLWWWARVASLVLMG